MQFLRVKNPRYSLAGVPHPLNVLGRPGVSSESLTEKGPASISRGCWQSSDLHFVPMSPLLWGGLERSSAPCYSNMGAHFTTACFINMCKRERKQLINRIEVTISCKLIMEVHLITFAALCWLLRCHWASSILSERTTQREDCLEGRLMGVHFRNLLSKAILKHMF